MRSESSFYKKNIERLKGFTECPECLREGLHCRHYDYLKAYIQELEKTPPLDAEKFNIFWEMYPRKIARKVAEGYWMKANINEKTFEIIIRALEFQKKSRQWTSDGGKYIPHPSTWLSQERWNDEVETTKSKYDSI